ncbi:hypothetical protein NL676_012388 [Syzygium grande]|nr:hypothetical protein NL676_012388 [Syzygium grande]
MVQVEAEVEVEEVVMKEEEVEGNDGIQRCYISSLFLALSSGMFSHVTSTGGRVKRRGSGGDFFPPAPRIPRAPPISPVDLFLRWRGPRHPTDETCRARVDPCAGERFSESGDFSERQGGDGESARGAEKGGWGPKWTESVFN